MTTYTLRIPVQAWRVEPDGSLPEEAERHILIEDGRWVTSKINEVDRNLVQPEKAGWWFWCLHRRDGIEIQRAHPGDWILRHDYGLEAMRDEAFRACCEEVKG